MVNSKPSLDKISFVTTHFYDFEWTSYLIHQIYSNTDINRIYEILIINQDRTNDSRHRLMEICPKANILEFPLSEKHFIKKGHDHAFVLNEAVKNAKGDLVCIFDSDCHPFSSQWLKICDDILRNFDAIVAVDTGKYYRDKLILSHPCFMLLKSDQISLPLRFDEHLFDQNFDTGRLIGQQLMDSGRKVFFACPAKGFEGRYGCIYLDSIYHHEKGSYAGGGERLLRQINWQQEYFKRIILTKHRYSLTILETVHYILKETVFERLSCFIRKPFRKEK